MSCGCWTEQRSRDSVAEGPTHTQLRPGARELPLPEDEATQRRGMTFPTSWDPYFTRYMTLADVYRYPTLHFEHHHRQLTLPAEPGVERPG
jgi:hypothetical protein